MNERNIFDTLQEEIMQSDLPEEEICLRLSVLLKAGSQKINLMLVGATGCGKSSTVNALFDMDAATVGIGVDPETKDIVRYELGNLIIWDTPGLGDTVENDKAHIEQIVRKLSETNDDGSLLIDLVLIVLDASSKDLAVSYDVINNTLIPCLGKDNAHRIPIALNQSDMAMKGRNWNPVANEPNDILMDFLEKKSASVKRRVFEATGITVEPVCYCAGYTDEDGERCDPYNLSKLLFCIMMAIPAEKRLILVDKLNAAEDNWTSSDGYMDYPEAINRGFFSSLLSGIGTGAEKGFVIGGCVIGVPGMVVGGLIGAIAGGLCSLAAKPFKFLSKLKSRKEFVDGQDEDYRNDTNGVGCVDCGGEMDC